MNHEYLKSINQSLDHPIIDDLKEQALKGQIPIITDEGIRFLIQILKIKKAKKVLEIGTAIGYSSILMALFTNVDITSIERDINLFNQAKKNVDLSGLNNRIHLILADANDISINDNDFDLVFIDAAKSSYIHFFDKFSKNIKSGGIIMSDNLLFRGQVADHDLIQSKNRMQLVKKINKFNEYIVNHPDFETYIYSIGDGISISIKK